MNKKVTICGSAGYQSTNCINLNSNIWFGSYNNNNNSRWAKEVMTNRVTPAPLLDLNAAVRAASTKKTLWAGPTGWCRKPPRIRTRSGFLMTSWFSHSKTTKKWGSWPIARLIRTNASGRRTVQQERAASASSVKPISSLPHWPLK